MKFFEVKRVHFNIDIIHKDDTDMTSGNVTLTKREVSLKKIYNLLNSQTLSPQHMQYPKINNLQLAIGYL